ncbi:MAG TPA: metallophosphoesterase family protein, partial [Candidatus Wunengus sp. YC60]|uniref:metallophosphoesterase family protein n=1 Tax=Candidatus Wunengus sp. YC60 TaxID=3367697 RepID=UPI004029582F
MKILILHLSDIHFKAKEDIILNRVENIKNVINKYANDISGCFTVVSGDIAFSGNSGEYLIARGFFDNLEERLKTINNSIYIKYIMVPGNHDCNFKNDNNVRKILIENMTQKVNSLNDCSIINTCTSTQKEFFEFLKPYSSTKDFQDFKALYYKQNITLGYYKIQFNCYNTAWMSQKDEKQHQIIFPIDLIKTNNDKFDIVLSVFHHPYSWFEIENGKNFQKYAEQTSDIILTGHEHDLGQKTQSKITGEKNEYIEGGILQGNVDNKNSEFNVLIVDLKEKKQKVIQYIWKNDFYSEKDNTDWLPFVRSKFLQKHEFKNNDTFVSYLIDPGANFTHPKKGNLNLNDIFIYPNLKEMNPEGK